MAGHWPGGGSSRHNTGEGSIIPPRGFKSQQFPLRHRLVYSFGLSALTETMNTTMITLVKNYKGANVPTTIDVNPHHASFDKETGAICNPMSIIDKLNIGIRFNIPSEPGTDVIKGLSFEWTPIFFSFAEKLDAVDDFTTSTVKSILSLTSDATQEDITPTFNNTKLPVGGNSDLVHPMSTTNFTEVFGTMNMDTDTTMEAITFDNTTLKNARAYYTNKGAINSILGRTRHEHLSENRRNSRTFIKKFVPRPIRRIMPYTYFGILIHLPIDSDPEQDYMFSALTASTTHLGCKLIANYHEWHSDHNQDMTG